MSQVDFATALGQTSVTISRWENGWNGAEIPVAIARQAEVLAHIYDLGVESGRFTREDFVEGLKFTGSEGAIAAAAAAGLISRTVLSTLAVIPSFGWLGAVFGIGVACSLPFFSKLRDTAEPLNSLQRAGADAEQEKPAPKKKLSMDGGTSALSRVRRSKRKKTLRKEKLK